MNEWRTPTSLDWDRNTGSGASPNNATSRIGITTILFVAEAAHFQSEIILELRIAVNFSRPPRIVMALDRSKEHRLGDEMAMELSNHDTDG